MKRFFSLNYFRKLANENEIKRISKKAIEELRDIIEEKVSEILKISNEIAKHAKRNTIFKDDIKIAIKKLNLE